MTGKQASILIVEDVPNILELLEVTLKFKGYDVISARDGTEALEKIADQRPGVVVTDILMPRMDGFAFVQKLRTDPKTHNIPVIFLSATYVSPEDKAFAMSLGAAYFLEKPIDTEEFLLTVAELLTRGHSTAPRTLPQKDFYAGYRARLENKLSHKNRQIARAERLLESLPDNQKPLYQDLLQQSLRDRQEIEAELRDLYKILDKLQE